MMNLKRLLPPLCLGSLLSVAFLATGVTSALGQVKNQPLSTPGEIILMMKPGIPKADVQALANGLAPASFQPLLLDDCYVIELKADQRNDNATANAVAILKTDTRVLSARASYVFKLHTAPPTGAAKAIPNDPYFTSGRMGGLTLINMVQGWALQKGQAGIRLGWIDSGFDPVHEDLKDQYDPASYDFGDNDTDITADGSGGSGEFDHGTGTSGVAFAHTDNGLGVSGICWQGIKCVALKITPKGTANLPEAAILNSYAYILNNYAKLNIHALNLSFGADGADPTDSTNPEYIATKKLTDAGVIVVASSGNSGGNGNPTSIPADYAHILSVSAVNNQGKLTYYSSYNKVEMAAPGGEQLIQDDPNGYPVCINDPIKKYAFEQGTSFAAPTVTAVLGLLLSVPGITPAQAKDALYKGADHTGLGTLPDGKYGYGILDAYGALSRVSVQAVITSPNGLDAQGQSSDPASILPPPVETFRPTVSFHLTNVTPDNVTVIVDAGVAGSTKTYTLAQIIAGNTDSSFTNASVTGTTTGPNPLYDVSVRVKFSTAGYQQHSIQITATDPISGISKSDTRIFTITPHTLPAGLSMISIPYFETAADSPSGSFRDANVLLGSGATLFRYLLPVELGSQPQNSTKGAYAIYGNGAPVSNVNASFKPSNLVPTLTPQLVVAGSTVDTRPIGVGYFLNSSGSIPVLTFGNSYSDRPIKIPLHEGWNLIGNPFPFNVSFNGLSIENPDGSRIPISDAVAKSLIAPNVYRFVGGDYEFGTLPDGNLMAWEGQWIFITPKNSAAISASTVLSLIVPPISSSTTRASSATPKSRVSGTGSWSIQLQAFSGESSDKNNFIGMSSKATDGNDTTKVPKPPKATTGVSLGIVRANSPAGTYAQDLRSIGGAKEWSVFVSNDAPGSEVTIKWPDAKSLPRSYRLVITDKVTGQSVDVRNASSYQYKSAEGETTRAFTLTARPTNSLVGKAVISNVVVNATRSSDGRSANLFDIGYNVSGDVKIAVSVLSFGGRQVAQVGATRAVNSGDNHITWNGRDNKGNAVPAGTYVLQMQATGVDGSISRVVQSLILTGR